MFIKDRVRWFWVFKKAENKSLNVYLRREGKREEEERKVLQTNDDVFSSFKRDPS